MNLSRTEVRETLRRLDPTRAARCDRVDPVPPPSPPCTCADVDKVEVTRLGDARPRLLCTGRCRP